MDKNKWFLPCSECQVFPDSYNSTDVMTLEKNVNIMCPCCGKVISGHNYEEATIAWNHYNRHKKHIIFREEMIAMKDILELVGKIEELLKKSKFEWFMLYDPKNKAWNFQIKEK